VVPEAAPRLTKNGLVVDVDGWFVLNARDSRWRTEGPLGSFCNFEGKRNRFDKVLDKPPLVEHAADVFAQLEAELAGLQQLPEAS